MEFEWNSVKSEAAIRSPELRRQRWRIKQNQLQLVAARNQLLPQLDLTALYRPLGIGDELGRLGSRSGRNLVEEGSFATDELFEGDYTEWRFALQYQMPFGFRQEMAQVRNQQLQLRRAEERLNDEELEIMHQLSAAIRRMRDRYQLAQTQFNALKAARDQVQAAETGYRIAQNVPLDVVLDAQSRQSQSEIDYFRALTEYNLAICRSAFPQRLAARVQQRDASRRALACESVLRCRENELANSPGDTTLTTESVDLPWSVEEVRNGNMILPSPPTARSTRQLPHPVRPTKSPFGMASTSRATSPSKYRMCPRRRRQCKTARSTDHSDFDVTNNGFLRDFTCMVRWRE